MTIFALSSGHGKAGVAVIRLSGPRCLDSIRRIAGSLPEPRRATLRAFRDPAGGGLLDRGLVLWFPGPRSFTGEDMAEFHIHGGRAVIDGLLAALGRLDGLRPAEPGEFARRAFEHGRLDLTEAEGLADLIDAETEAQRHQALRQSAGALRTLYDGWRTRLVEAMAAIEADLDFADEGDVPDNVAAAARPPVAALARDIAAHLDDQHRGEIVRSGLRVVIAGPPNAGKSSLLNALAQRDVAIVSDEAGTTRDVIEVHLNLGGYPVIVMDTAGLRAAVGRIEQEGMRRAVERAEDADLVLWLTDAGAPPVARPDVLRRLGDKVIEVVNKIDLLGDDAGRLPAPAISATTGAGLRDLVSRLTSEAEARIGALDAPVITRARHRRELEVCRAAMQRFLAGKPGEVELRAEDLRQAATALGRITGRVDVEDVLDRIFAAFCIGK